MRIELRFAMIKENLCTLYKVKQLFSANFATRLPVLVLNLQRADYLYRELLKLEDIFLNVRLARERFATIWGGASRLQAHLSIMKTLLTVFNWRWDYYINLSETHYPIK